MVQKGKFSAGAEALVNTLKNVDFLSRAKIKRYIEEPPNNGHIGTKHFVHHQDVKMNVWDFKVCPL